MRINPIPFASLALFLAVRSIIVVREDEMRLGQDLSDVTRRREMNFSAETGIARATERTSYN